MWMSDIFGYLMLLFSKQETGREMKQRSQMEFLTLPVQDEDLCAQNKHI